MAKLVWEGFPWLRTHVHPRQSAFREATMRYVVESCGGAVLVLNFDPPVWDDVGIEREYLSFVDLFARLGRPNFQFALAFIVTPDTKPAMIERIAHLPCHKIAKFFPIAKNGTTGAHWGLPDFLSPSADELNRALAAALIRSMWHAEIQDPTGRIPLLIREQLAVPVMREIRSRHPELDMTIAHVSSLEMAAFVLEARGSVVGEITSQHVQYSIEDTIGLSRRCCMPRIKDTDHQEAVIDLMLSGRDFVVAGNDWAPHGRKAKEGLKPANGVIFGPGSELAAYAEAHRKAGKLHQLDQFLSGNAARLYGFEQRGSMVLAYDDENPWMVEESYADVIPANAMEQVFWRLESLDY